MSIALALLTPVNVKNNLILNKDSALFYLNIRWQDIYLLSKVSPTAEPSFTDLRLAPLWLLVKLWSRAREFYSGRN